MQLFATLNQRLTDTLLAQLASASVLPLAVAKNYCAVAVPALVRQLAKETDEDELNARWDMCRQLFLGQVLTDANELLRADMGWPDRRRYLAQKIIGPEQVVALAKGTSQPAQADTLLGYLTIIALATVGEKAYEATLDPAALGSWLEEQQVPVDANGTKPAARPALRTQGAAAQPKAAETSAGSKKITILSAVGALVVAGVVGGYFLLSNPANATQQEANTSASTATVTDNSTPTAPVDSRPAEPAATSVAGPTPLLVSAAAAPSAAPKAQPVSAAAAGAVIRDTIGNAALAKQIGGKFNVAEGRYLKGEGQPLIVKLPNRATLSVGINSTESLLYKRLAKPSLPRPSDIAVDRLAFDTNQARLGAEGAQQLGNIASLLKTFPKAKLLIVGHANNSESQAIRLGLQRATAAVDELVKQGITADRLQAQGVLSTNLPTENDSAEKQAMLQGISLKISRL
jgi:outer membrane protein OmpA-like peptidoglycan-associated protein